MLVLLGYPFCKGRGYESSFFFTKEVHSNMNWSLIYSIHLVQKEIFKGEPYYHCGSAIRSASLIIQYLNTKKLKTHMIRKNSNIIQIL